MVKMAGVINGAVLDEKVLRLLEQLDAWRLSHQEKLLVLSSTLAAVQAEQQGLSEKNSLNRALNLFGINPDAVKGALGGGDGLG